MVKPFFPKKTKKPLFYKLITIGASISILVLPVLAQASTFSFISSLLGRTAEVLSADSSSDNSQTMPLLSAAVNLDPNPSIGGGDITVVESSALVAQEGPSGTAADITNGPTNAQISVYTVRDGDTLSQIAQMFNVSVNTIIGANDIQDGIIHPGQTLVILPITGIEHTVASGETLDSLATTYSSNAHDIAVYNNLADGATLTVGTTLLIPNGELGSSNNTSTNTTTTTKKPVNSHSKAIANIASGKSTEPYLGGSGPALAGYFSWPLAGGIITQGLHGWNAVDIGAPKGTSIYAAAAGTVIVANGNGGWNGGYGNYVVISHPNGTETLYAHMSKVLTTAGSSVTTGETIGRVGMTGEATGPHLHFEVRGAVNPFAELGVGYSQ